MRAMGEGELVRRVRLGDRQACSELVREHYAPVYQLLARLTRDAHAAEDLCQETFAAAWAKIGGFAGDSAIRTWLHRIAYTRFIDWSRKARSQRNANVQTERRADAPRPLDDLLADERQAELQDALDRLDPPHRDVLVLYYLQGLTFREAAQVLAEPAATVRWRAAQALARLREILKPTENDDEDVRRQRSGAAPARAAGAGDPAGA